MKKIKIFKLSAIVSLIVLIVICLIYIITRDNDIEIQNNNTYDETIIAVADIDFEPFSFLGENSVPAGHDIELLHKLSEILGVNIEINLMNWSDCKQAVIDGEADIIMGLDYRVGGYPGILSSKAILTDRFVCFGNYNYSDISELYDKKLAVIEYSGCLADFLEPYQLTPNTVTYPTYTDVIQSVIDGYCDYAIVRYSVGRRILAKLGNETIRAEGPVLSYNSMCIGVNESKPDLLDTLNEAINRMAINGDIKSLSDKWMGKYIELLSFGDFLRIYKDGIFAAVFCVVIFIAIVIFISYRGRMKTIHEKQKNLIQKKEIELKESQLAITLSQIGPHFIYNSLVVIKQLCDIDPAEAKNAIKEFSDYLRVNLDSVNKQRPILFESELQHVNNYLSLEQKRFGEKIKVHYKIKATGFFIPPLTVQPIAENAVRYGLCKKEEGGAITISSHETESHYIVKVEDNGVGFNAKESKNDGRSHIGIQNVKNRLIAMCNGDLSIESKIGEGTIVTIEIPK